MAAAALTGFAFLLSEDDELVSLSLSFLALCGRSLILAHCRPSLCAGMRGDSSPPPPPLVNIFQRYGRRRHLTFTWPLPLPLTAALSVLDPSWRALLDVLLAAKLTAQRNCRGRCCDLGP